jgi:hypothetical protein
MTVAEDGETEMLTLVLVGATVTRALALLVESAALVALIVTFVALLTAGAVNLPASVMVPELVVQCTLVLLVPVTAAVNCCPPLGGTVIEVGETATLTLEPVVVTETVALALFVLSATLVARTVTVVEVVTFGAVRVPVLEIVPALADQVTAVLLTP